MASFSLFTFLLTAFSPPAQSHVFEKCIVQTTPWSQCSKTCGTGISTRVTNDNSECKLVKESRLCEVRPCTQSPYSSLKVRLGSKNLTLHHGSYKFMNQIYSTSQCSDTGLALTNQCFLFFFFSLAYSQQKGKKCNRTKKSTQAVKFTYAGCSSLKKYRPKYCGSCVDGRCCSPQQTRTIRVKFRCEDGETFNKNVMMIETCKCTFNCPHSNEASFPFYRLFNDIHKFRD